VDEEERVSGGEPSDDVVWDWQAVNGSVGETEEGAVREGEPGEQRRRQPLAAAPPGADGAEADAVGVGL
jgi:hypothetical protein